MDRARGQRRRAPQVEPDVGPAPPEVHPAIAHLRGLHRAAHPDEGTILEASAHLMMAKEWETSCPRFIEAVRMLDLDCIRHLHFIEIDHHLLTSLVERWSYQTNTFHLPVGEITVTLQDVGIILGVRVDGPALVGPNMVGIGRRWESWPDCCDELLGSHPDPSIVYHHPADPTVTTSFRMGQAKSQTCLPLRWLRWTYSRQSYVDLPDHIFTQHIRAYLLFILGSFLIPDTSGSEIHVQYLPLMEDLHIFSQYSIGSAILAHLYRELREATRPRRVNMAGCLHLLQVWSWERLYVGRPTLHLSTPRDIEQKSLGYRWSTRYIRDQPSNNVRVYRDELDGLQPSQVTWEPYDHDILLRLSSTCMLGFDTWHCRVPLISWRRVEWHLPDRVSRQFGQAPRTDMEPMELGFERVDGRGKAGVDWSQFHARYIQLWNDRIAYSTRRDDEDVDRRRATTAYMRWYKGWASLFLLRAPTVPPTTYYPRSPSERILQDFYRQTRRLLEPYHRGSYQTSSQQAIDEVVDLAIQLEQSVYIADFQDYDSSEPQGVETATDYSAHGVETATDYRAHGVDTAGDITLPVAQSSFPASSFFTSYTPWMTPGAGPSTGPGFTTASPYDQYYPSQPLHHHVVEEVEEEETVGVQEHHQLRERPRRPPDHYTPGSDAIPHRQRRRRQ